MKTKHLGKVLTLKKKTIANLNNVEMTAIVGGGTWMTCDCASHSPIEPSCICEEFRTDITMCDCPPPY
jgi:natural product precursor